MMDPFDQLDSELITDSRILVTNDDTHEDQEVFNSGLVSVDWSAYNFARSYVETVGHMEEREIDLGDASIHAIYVKTNVPVILQYTQDSEVRKFTVSPSVRPENYFITDRSPGAKPDSYQPGVFLATGSPITALTIVGITGVKAAASVLVALAGYR